MWELPGKNLTKFTYGLVKMVEEKQKSENESSLTYPEPTPGSVSTFTIV
jgi:hypothetical protein